MASQPQSEPVHLLEDAETGDRFLVYGTAKGVRVELRYEGETLWMTQRQMSDLFGVGVPAISKHLLNIFEEGELASEASMSNLEMVAPDGKRRLTNVYNLDAIISVGYRVSSKEGTLFRKWATDTLVRFATKGFVVDSARLKAPDAQDRIAELREIIRDIRADEANVYRELRRICAMCRDYDPKSPEWHSFYARTQARFMWAVTTHTPSEMIKSRSNAEHPNMGLRTWANDEIRKSDSEVAKNYLVEHEIKELNRLTVILLDIFEDQAELGRLTTMSEAEKLLETQLKSLGRAVLNGGGVVKSKDAKAHAHREYDRFNEQRRRIRHAQADAALSALKRDEKSLPKTKKSAVS